MSNLWVQYSVSSVLGSKKPLVNHKRCVQPVHFKALFVCDCIKGKIVMKHWLKLMMHIEYHLNG